jgi:choline dehydrogenase
MKTYDYVIVGAGSAGCVLAARLSEDPNITVALVEAGDEDTAPEIRIPLAALQLAKTKYDWDFYSEPEPGLGGRAVPIARGKGIGGTSSINAMVYIRGNAADFDNWEKGGASGWSYKDMLRYFIKGESNERGDERFHGQFGPLSVQDARYVHPLSERFIEAATQAGHPYNDDFNGATQLGVGYFQLTQRDGERCSAAHAYLHPVRYRSNLQVLTGALVLKVLLDGTLATGVSIFQCGKEEILRAEREVILSAGTYGSPQLLMLSGIGPAAMLKGFNIATAIDLPVGEDLQDHVLAGVTYRSNEPSLLRAGSAADVALYMKEGKGPLTSNGIGAGAFLSTVPGETVPDIELYMAPALIDDVYSAPKEDGFGILVSLIHSRSRGKVTLRSGRPDAKPRILTNVLTSPEDQRTIVNGLRAAMNIARQPKLAEVRVSDYNVPNSDSDSDVRDYIRKQATTDRHPAGTCGMGRVVDSELRVLGIDDLRVVDASVMPTIPRGNLNAGVCAIAEKAAELIVGKRR